MSDTKKSEQSSDTLIRVMPNAQIDLDKVKYNNRTIKKIEMGGGSFTGVLNPSESLEELTLRAQDEAIYSDMRLDLNDFPNLKHITLNNITLVGEHVVLDRADTVSISRDKVAVFESEMHFSFPSATSITLSNIGVGKCLTGSSLSTIHIRSRTLGALDLSNRHNLVNIWVTALDPVVTLPSDMSKVKALVIGNPLGGINKLSMGGL